MEKALVLTKSNGHLGSLITRFEQKGYKMLALKVVPASEANKLKQQTPDSKLPSVVMVWAGPNIVSFSQQLYQLNECQMDYTSLNDITARQDISYWFGESS